MKRKIILILILLLIVSSGCDKQNMVYLDVEQSKEEYRIISDDEIDLKKIKKGVHAQDVIGSVSYAKAYAEIIFKSVLGENYRDFEETTVYYISSRKIWIINKSLGKNMLGGGCSCAIRQSDGKVLKIWSDE